MSEFDDEPKDNLGSLSQHARTKSLKSARSILIVIGLLIAGAHAVLFALAENMLDKNLEKEKAALGPGMVFDEVKLKQIRDSEVRAMKLLCVAFALAGVAMICLGIFIYKAPVVCTVLGLVIYVAAWLIPVVLAALGDSPEEAGKALVSGIIIKIFIIVGLVKAIQAAVAYQAETAERY